MHSHADNCRQGCCYNPRHKCCNWQQLATTRLSSSSAQTLTYAAILTASCVLLLAFAIERGCHALKVPSVIALIAAGLVLRPLIEEFHFTPRGLDIVVPIIGTLGLILIVLEGAMDIKLKRERMRAVLSAVGVAVGGVVAVIAAFTGFAALAFDLPLLKAMLLAIPFAVISSAVAISSSGFLPSEQKEFVVYESSISDIFGVLLFFSLLNSDGTVSGAIAAFAGGGAISLALSILFAVGLVLILMRIDGHVRFIPLLAGLFGLYALGELLHLSPLILVLLFGLTLNNRQLLSRFSIFRNWFDDSYDERLNQFKMLVLELTFAVRGFFFLLLGYWSKPADMTSLNAWLVAAVILVTIYASRYLLLRAARQPMADVVTWIAPRGLVTVLLLLHAQNALQVPGYLNGAVIIVVLVSSALIGIARLKLAKSETNADTGIKAQETET